MSSTKKTAAEIDYINKIDFTMGFESFHVRWPVKNFYEEKFSYDFETKISNGAESISLFWSLGIEKRDEKGWLGLSPVGMLDKRLPVIYHLALSSGNKLLYNSAFFHVFDEYGWGEEFTPEEISKFIGNDLCIHCWLAISNAVVIESNTKKDTKISTEDDSFDLKISSKFIDLFNGVKNGDAGFSSFSDITLVILDQDDEEVRRFPFHRNSLSASSTVFRQMFINKEWKENAAKDERIVEIKDIDGNTMEIILDYIYTNRLPGDDCESPSNIVHASHKYNLPDLTKWCASILINNHDAESARIEQLVLADRHGLDQLKAVCIAQLSWAYFLAFGNSAARESISSELYNEIMEEAGKKRFVGEISVASV